MFHRHISLASLLLGMPPSSVSVERIISCLVVIHTKTGDRLGNEKLVFCYRMFRENFDLDYKTTIEQYMKFNFVNHDIEFGNLLKMKMLTIHTHVHTHTYIYIYIYHKLNRPYMVCWFKSLKVTLPKFR